jgi:hypothetical protein
MPLAISMLAKVWRLSCSVIVFMPFQSVRLRLRTADHASGVRRRRRLAKRRGRL